jgi:hypothetical protein
LPQIICDTQAEFLAAGYELYSADKIRCGMELDRGVAGKTSSIVLRMAACCFSAREMRGAHWP